MSISRRLFDSLLWACVFAVLLVAVVRFSPVAPVTAQSSTWEVIAQPEAVAGVTLSIIRHAVTKDCLLIVQSGTGLSVVQGYGGSGSCDTPEEYAARKRAWEDVSGWSFGDAPGYLRMAPDNVSSQPSVGQTTKQPGVPR
jgi:hypothetical protein